jgi:hypothetical protein
LSREISFSRFRNNHVLTCRRGNKRNENEIEMRFEGSRR